MIFSVIYNIVIVVLNRWFLCFFGIFKGMIFFSLLILNTVE